jgi:hypothetical protein
MTPSPTPNAELPPLRRTIRKAIIDGRSKGSLARQSTMTTKPTDEFIIDEIVSAIEKRAPAEKGDGLDEAYDLINEIQHGILEGEGSIKEKLFNINTAIVLFWNERK